MKIIYSEVSLLLCYFQECCALRETELGSNSCSVHILRLRYSHSYKYLADPAIVVYPTDAVSSPFSHHKRILDLSCGPSNNFF